MMAIVINPWHHFCENEDGNEETNVEDVVGLYDDSSFKETICREFINHQSKIDHEEHCCNRFMSLSKLECDKQNEDGDSFVV